VNDSRAAANLLMDLRPHDALESFPSMTYRVRYGGFGHQNRIRRHFMEI